MRDPWNRCDDCGRFISHDDFSNNGAVRVCITPSAEGTEERWQTLCPRHAPPRQIAGPPPMPLVEVICKHCEHIQKEPVDNCKAWECRHCGRFNDDPALELLQEIARRQGNLFRTRPTYGRSFW